MTQNFTSPPDPAAYNARVWEIVRQIPAGSMATYGQIARLVAGSLPLPEGMTIQDFASFGARWVGGAMAACPEGVPWQRVINSQGKISLRRGGGHLAQRALLEAEGVEFDDRERVDLTRYGWAGPEDFGGDRQEKQDDQGGQIPLF